MITLEDTIIEHETRFAEFVDGELLGEDIPKYMGENFKTYYLNIIHQLLNIKGTTIPKDSRLNKVKRAEESMDKKIIEFYNDHFKEKEYPANDWIGVIKSIFPYKADYWKAVKPIIVAYRASLEEVKKGLVGSLPNLYQNVIEACIVARKQIANMIYSTSNEEETAPETIDMPIENSLRDRRHNYTFTYKLFVIYGKNAEVIDIDELKPDDLMDPNKTMFGRVPTIGSVFDIHRLYDEGIPDTKQKISRKHGCLYFSEDGDLVYKQLGRYDSTAEDYKGTKLDVIQGRVFPLFPAHFDMDFATANIMIKGINQDYKLELILEKEKGLNQKR